MKQEEIKFLEQVYEHLKMEGTEVLYCLNHSLFELRNAVFMHEEGLADEEVATGVAAGILRSIRNKGQRPRLIQLRFAEHVGAGIRMLKYGWQ